MSRSGDTAHGCRAQVKVPIIPVELSDGRSGLGRVEQLPEDADVDRVQLCGQGGRYVVNWSSLTVDSRKIKCLRERADEMSDNCARCQESLRREWNNGRRG